ncbi:hypothetical protein MG293_012912 [Ovis ammon polii]|uniref:Uncharacterized protein n=1 Tax=Ovis ammon polii TaxID=230172 RepID=A0AAD4Y6I3_OVIAM|nr:hypothetical protein MG293_012912 [Ovis ammon polii]
MVSEGRCVASVFVRVDVSFWNLLVPDVNGTEGLMTQGYTFCERRREGSQMFMVPYDARGKPYPAAYFSSFISLDQHLKSVHQQTFISYARAQSSTGEGERGQTQQGQEDLCASLEIVCDVNDGPQQTGKWHDKHFQDLVHQLPQRPQSILLPDACGSAALLPFPATLLKGLVNAAHLPNPVGEPFGIRHLF